MLSGRGSANAKKLTWMHLKVFKCVLLIHLVTFILTCSAISNLKIMSVVTM